MKKEFYIPELDGLRGIAVLCVLIGHVHIDFWFKKWFQGVTRLNGDLGVDIFFVLSGFLITRILLHDQENGRSRLNFFARRFARLMPAYLLFIAIVTVIWGIGPELPWSLTYTYNYGRFFGYFLGEKPLGHTWSLCVEEHFYLVWPVLLWFFSKRASLFCVLAIAVSALSAFLIDTSATEGLLHYIRVYQPTHTRLIPISIGCLIALNEVRIKSSIPNLLLLALTAQGLAIGFGSHGLFRLVGIDLGQAPLAAELMKQNFQAVAIFTFVFWAHTAGFRPFNRLMANKPLCWVGKVSYGLYLYHFPIYWFLALSGPAKAASPFTPWLGFVLTFFAAGVSYRYYEAPILAWVRTKAFLKKQQPSKSTILVEMP